jgi:hypothetical protein
MARVRDLRTKAISLRKDFSNNDDTWRSLIEIPLMGRFDQEVVWSVTSDRNTSSFMTVNSLVGYVGLVCDSYSIFGLGFRTGLL